MKTRGFTLMEVVVTLAILGIVIGALFGVVQGQQTAFYQGNLQRAAQGSARAAFAYVEERVAQAGYGMEPSLAFDFTSPVAPCPFASCPRDSTSDNDELVFYSRNAQYWVPASYTAEPVGNAWRITSFDALGGTVNVNARANDVFARGRIVQAVCSGTTAYAYGTVAQTVKAAAAGSLQITLLPVDATNPFRRQDVAQSAVAAGCFGSGQARLFLIDRFRFHVRPVTVSGAVVPYLVLDPGLDANGDGFDPGEEIIVAEGIETFQVAYELTNTALAARGSVPGTPITFTQGDLGATAGNGMTTLRFPGTITDPATETVYDPTSWFGYAVGPPPASQRLTDHQANIRAVRVSLRARAPATNPSGGAPGALVPVLNQDTLPAWIDPRVNYDRARVDGTILVRNMVSRGLLDR
jgi:type IV pilus assembly protein PilW